MCVGGLCIFLRRGMLGPPFVVNHWWLAGNCTATGLSFRSQVKKRRRHPYGLSKNLFLAFVARSSLCNPAWCMSKARGLRRAGGFAFRDSLEKYAKSCTSV